LSIVALFSLKEAQAIFEKNKGLNEWHIENLGEIHDLKFVEEDQETEVPARIYSITTDGVLSLFNVKTQQFVWKRQLTAQNGNEDAKTELFNLSYLSRNLLVHSKHRAMLVNTAGHANLEVDFGTLFG
jgi:hypothetical protein